MSSKLAWADILRVPHGTDRRHELRINAKKSGTARLNVMIKLKKKIKGKKNYKLVCTVKVKKKKTNTDSSENNDNIPTASPENNDDVTIDSSVNNDKELSRAYGYAFIPREWFSSKKLHASNVSVGSYNDALIDMIEKIDKSQVTKYKAYLEEDLDRTNSMTPAIGMIFDYLSMYLLTPHDSRYGLNFEKYMSMINWDDYNWAGTYKQSMAYEAPMLRFGVTMEWDIVSCAYFYTMNEISPIAGKPVFPYPDGVYNSTWLNNKISYEEAIRSLSRTYEYIKNYRFCRKSPDLPSDIKGKVDERRSSILNSISNVEYTGKAYYVSADGSDENDGLSESTPWKTMDKVNNASLQPGDAVFFRRGDTWRATLYTKNSVVYSAYGEGAKPVLTTSPEDGAGADKWSLYAEGDHGEKIWVYHRKMQPLGCIFMDGFTKYASKYPENYVNGVKMSITREGKPFDLLLDLKDMQFYSSNDEYGSYFTPFTPFDFDYEGPETGELYLRCDAGNPGEIYHNIEFGTQTNNVLNSDGIVLDNLCMILGNCSTADHGRSNQTIQNCEVAYCGGGASLFDGAGTMLQGGDGILAGGWNNRIMNNYVHDCWDNGIAFEELPDQNSFENTIVKGNLLEYNNGGILFANWFMTDSNTPPLMKHITIEDNYVLHCGEGWSYQIHYNNPPTSPDTFSSVTNGINHDFVITEDLQIKNNVFAFSAGPMLTYSTKDKAYAPIYDGNTYICDGIFVADYDDENQFVNYYGADDMDKVYEVIGDKTGTYIPVDMTFN